MLKPCFTDADERPSGDTDIVWVLGRKSHDATPITASQNADAMTATRTSSLNLREPCDVIAFMTAPDRVRRQPAFLRQGERHDLSWILAS